MNRASTAKGERIASEHVGEAERVSPKGKKIPSLEATGGRDHRDTGIFPEEWEILAPLGTPTQKSCTGVEPPKYLALKTNKAHVQEIGGLQWTDKLPLWGPHLD